VQTIVGADNRIDAGEISDASQDLKKASDPTVASRLTGGLALKLPAGTIYQGTTLPSSSTAVTTNVSGSIDYLTSTVTGGSAGTATPGVANITASDTGNYILTGTAANPLVIDGKVMIDGDVILRGYIKGTGQLFVTGNVYLPGDVVYANANVGTIQEQFGTATDGTSNLLGVIAGKNIVVGDFLSQITTWNSGDTNQLTPLELQTTVLSNGTKTNTLVAKPGSTEPGKKLTYVAPPNTTGTYKTYVGPTQVDGYTMPAITLPSGTTMPTAVSNTVSVSSTQTFVGTNEPNFIMQQLTLFNRNELMKTMQYLPTANPTQSASYTAAGGGILNNSTNAPAATAYDANYIPRFYSFYPYDGTNATTKQTNPALALIYSGSTYNSTNKTWNGATDPHGFDYFTSVDTMPANSVSNAALYAKSVINVAPNWITPANMLRITTSEQAARTSVIADAELNPTSPYLVPDRRIDGIMYTKNAVLCIERSKALSFNTSTGAWTRVNTVSGGRVQVNGAMIAPDTGLLICDGPEHASWPSRQNFIINYDSRVRNLLKIANQDFSSFTSWGVTRITMVRNTGSLPPAP